MSNLDDLVKLYFPSSSRSTTSTKTNAPAPSPDQVKTAAKRNAERQQRSVTASTRTRNVVYDLVDCFHAPPPQLTSDYMEIVLRAASFLEIEDAMDAETAIRKTGSRSVWREGSFPEQDVAASSTSTTRPQFVSGDPDSQEKFRNATNGVRNKVYAVANRVNSFVARAKNAGFVPPDNPFMKVINLNRGRVGFSALNISDEEITQITDNIRSYIKLLRAEDEGKLNIDSNVKKAAQLSSVSLSFEGIGGSGDAAADLARLLPDADELKAQRTSEALSALDFTKRIPKVLFTANYAPDGSTKGVIVGWKKMPDASGYIIRRRSIFEGKEISRPMSNADLETSTNKLRGYLETWILTFYDSINHDSIVAMLDEKVPEHEYYLYRVRAYQTKNESPGTMFSVGVSPANMSLTEIRNVNIDMAKITTRSAETVSPYPVLAKILLGDSKYDWLLAAINIRNSINRGDARSTTRRYSYLTANLDFILEEDRSKRFVVPTGRDVSSVHQKIGDSIARFGVSQALREVLSDTGALYHFDGKESNTSQFFNKIDLSSPRDSGIIATVMAAVDPETAVLNLRSLATNMPDLLSGRYVGANEKIMGPDKTVFRPSRVDQGPREITIPAEFDNPTDKRAEDEIQQFNKLGALSADIADLTTVDGIGSFMRVVRIFSDIGPGRGTSAIDVPEELVPDPILPYTPPPPPVTATSPAPPPVIEAGSTSTDVAKAAEEEKRVQEEQRAEQERARQTKRSTSNTAKGGGRRPRDPEDI